jgi:hypothetical protein
MVQRFENPGTYLTGGNRLAAMLLAGRFKEPKTHSQGLANIAKAGMAGLMQGRDRKQQEAVTRAFTNAMKERGPPDGPPSLAGPPPTTMERLQRNLGQIDPNNPYLARTQPTLLAAQVDEETAAEERERAAGILRAGHRREDLIRENLWNREDLIRTDKQKAALELEVAKSSDPNAYEEYIRARDDGGFTGTFFDYKMALAMGSQGIDWMAAKGVLPKTQMPPGAPAPTPGPRVSPAPGAPVTAPAPVTAGAPVTAPAPVTARAPDDVSLGEPPSHLTTPIPRPRGAVEGSPAYFRWRESELKRINSLRQWQEARAGPMSEIKKKEIGRGKLTTNLGMMVGAYLKLDELGGLVDPNKSTVENLWARLSSSDIGHFFGEAAGTETASIRNRINNVQPLLIQAIREATGMSARGLDSNKELQFYLQSSSKTTGDLLSNLVAIDVLDQTFGLGGVLKATLPKEIYDRVRNQSKLTIKTEPILPTITTDEEWEKLPKGTLYRDDYGLKRRK